MKTFEDLEGMTVAQLTAIATDLGLSPNAKIKKPELVQLVYDAQQPEPTEPVEAEAPVGEKRPVTTGEEFEGKLKEIAEHFGGTDVIEAGENEDGVSIFTVVDELTDEEKATGTFLELYEQAKNAPAPNEPIDLDKEAGTGENEMSALPDLEEVITETPPVADDDNLAEITEGLKPLKNFGLHYKIDNSVIQFRVGSKVVSTTLNQPAHRVVRTAEQLCNFR